jgi:hypothetical protein
MNKSPEPSMKSPETSMNKTEPKMNFSMNKSPTEPVVQQKPDLKSETQFDPLKPI